MRQLLLLAICAATASAVALGIGDNPPSRPNTPELAVAGPIAAFVSDSTPIDDPFLIHRIRANESQIPNILKQADSGPLVQLGRNDFEARVRTAGRLVAEARTVPHITHTRYNAALVGGTTVSGTLVGGDLVGTAELDLVNASSVSQFLVLDPLRLALTPATWADGREAVVGVPPGSSTTSVWVDRPGRQTLKFGWSAAGVTEFGERRFELRVPPALSTVLDLELPAGQRPTVPADVLLTGPFPVKGDSSQLNWRFRFGGRPRLDLAVRPVGNAGVSASSSLAAHFDITPGQLACTFEYDLRPAKGTVGEWAFTVDPGLRVTDVVVNNRQGWSVDPPTAPGGSRRLRINLNQPGTGGKVMVSGVAAFPDPSRPADSPLPMIRPVGAVLDEETMEIRLAPELKPAKWIPGDYRLTDSQLLPDQTHTIALYGTLLPSGTDRVFRQSPTITTRTTEPEFTTAEQIAWRFDTDRVTAQVRLGIRIRRSPLFRLTLRTPSGYSFARVTSPQDDLIASATISGGSVNVEFARPLMPGQTADLAFEFRGPRTGPNRFAFPAFTPIGASERVGVLGINPGPLWAIDPKPGVGMTPTNWLDLNVLHPPVDATVAYRYRGSDPDGWVTLTPVRPEFTADVESRIERSANAAIAKSTLTLRLRAGGLPSIFIAEPEAGFAERTWRITGGGNSVESATPVPIADFVRQFGLLAPGILGRVAALSAWKSPRQGQLWAIRFAHTATGEIVLETTATRMNPDAVSPSPLTVLGAVESRVVHDPTLSRTNRQTSEREWSFSDVYLVTAVRSERDVEFVFGGTVTSAAANYLPIRLPIGAEVRATCVEGRWVERGVQQLSPEGVLAVPIPARELSRFEMRYQLPIATGFPTQIQSPEPGLPGSGTEVHRSWLFGGNILPGWPIRAWDRARTADLPALLGGSPVTGPGVLVSRTPVDEVRVGSIQTANVAGIALATGLFLLCWAGGRRRHPLCGLLVVGGLLAVGTTSLLGPPWWQRAAIIPVAIGLLAAAGMVVTRGHRAVGTLVAGIMVLCVLSHTSSLAQPLRPAVVVILPPDADGKENVVAPKAVLDRLAAISRSTPPGVLITAADYTVTVDDTTARVTAKLIAHAFGDADLTAILPLSDAKLESVAVDGLKELSISQRQGIYAVLLPATGRHEIQIRFAVPVTGTGTEREFRFGVPESPTTRVTADFPASARQLQFVGRVGRQTMGDGTQKHMEVDAGSVRAVQFRWREGVGVTASIKVREACVWDVSEKGAELTACYITRVEQGTISALQFDLPGELEPVEVALRSLDATGGAALRDWSLSSGAEPGGFRRLRLDLQGPTTGRMLTVLSFRLKKAVTRQPLLRFPKPVIQGGITEPDTVYGLRAKELTNKVTIEGLLGRIGTIDYDPGALIRDKDWTKVSELRLDTNTPIRVFRPTPGANSELRPTLRPATDTPTVNLNTSWHVAPHRAEAIGTIQWSDKEPMPLIEFTVPGLRILEIRGPDVGTWTQTAGRVSVWFRKPVNEGELEWIGIVTPIPDGQQPPNPLPFEAVTPRILDSRLATEIVRVRPVEGWAARVDRDHRGWTATNHTGEGLSFQTTTPAAMPIHLFLTPAPRSTSANPFGWFNPSPRPRIAVEPSVTPPTRTEASESRPAISQTEKPATPTPTPAWVLPVYATIGWSIAMAVLALLLIRLPRTTWPEQFGLVTGLFGMAVVGHWWFGLGGWIAARVVWLVEIALRSPDIASQGRSK